MRSILQQKRGVKRGCTRDLMSRSGDARKRTTKREEGRRERKAEAGKKEKTDYSLTGRKLERVTNQQFAAHDE